MSPIIGKATVLSLAGLSFVFLRFLYTAFAFPVLVQDADVAPIIWTIMLVGSSLVQCPVILYSRNGRRIMDGMAFPMTVLCVLACFGMLMMYYGYVSFQSRALCYAGAFVASFGAGALTSCWKETSECLVTKQIQMATVFMAILFASMMYLLCLSLPIPFAVALNSLAPILSVIALRRSYLAIHRDHAPGVRFHTVGDHASAIISSRTQVVPLVALLIYASLISVPQCFWKSRVLPFVEGGNSSWSLMTACAIVLVGLIGITDYSLRRTETGSRVADITLLTVTLAAMLAPFFFNDSQTFLNISVFAGLVLYWAVFYSELDDVSIWEYGGAWIFSLLFLMANIVMLLAAPVRDMVSANHLWIVGVVLGISSVVAFIMRTITRRSMPDRFRPIQTELAEDGSDDDGALSVRYDRIMATFGLSSRELEVLEYLARGYSAKLIADKLFISYNTVKTYMGRIYKKLDVHTRDELVQVIADFEEPRTSTSS